MVAAAVGLAKIIQAGNGAGEHAPPQRRVGHKAYAQLAAKRQDVRLDKAAPQRILGLQRGNRVHPGRAANGVWPRLGQPQVAHLALLHQPLHSANSVLDRHRRINAVLVIQVDHLHTQPGEAFITCFDHIFRAAVGAGLAIGHVHIAKLAGDDRLFAIAVGERAAQQLLVLALGISVGGVEKISARVQGRAHRGNGLSLVHRTVEVGHGHTAQAQRRDLQPAFTELPSLHLSLLGQSLLNHWTFLRITAFQKLQCRPKCAGPAATP